jgi:hypothetical protein
MLYDNAPKELSYYVPVKGKTILHTGIKVDRLKNIPRVNVEHGSNNLSW